MGAAVTMTVKPWHLIVAGVVLVALLVVAGVGAWRAVYPYGDNNSEFPEGLFFLCEDADCEEEFTLTVKEFGRHHEEHWGKPVPCPKCGGKSVRAEKCPHCERSFKLVRDRQEMPCPHCEKTIGAPTKPQ